MPVCNFMRAQYRHKNFCVKPYGFFLFVFQQGTRNAANASEFLKACFPARPLVYDMAQCRQSIAAPQASDKLRIPRVCTNKWPTTRRRHADVASTGTLNQINFLGRNLKLSTPTIIYMYRLGTLPELWEQSEANAVAVNRTKLAGDWLQKPKAFFFFSFRKSFIDLPAPNQTNC